MCFSLTAQESITFMQSDNRISSDWTKDCMCKRWLSSNSSALTSSKKSLNGH